MFVLSAAAYLYMSDPALRDTVPMLRPVVMLLATIVPYFLWSFARAIFEHPWPSPFIVWPVLFAGIAAWVIYLAADIVGPDWVMTTNIFMHFVSLVIVLHALWFAAFERVDDLLERRRSFRLLFVVLVAAQVLAVLVVELFLGRSEPPGWLALGNVIIIGLLTMGLAIPMFRLNSDFFAASDVAELAPPEGETGKLSPADQVLHAKLIELMESGYYRETGLTIRSLAEEIGFPEHRLRRLINGGMGYRNFSAFLHSYRLQEAKQRLCDPEFARTPVLTIALDLGYASIGPFNRAFKESTGSTPTDFRRQNFRADSADSE